MRIVFFGTPEFAVASLNALLRERFTVAGVVTQPDKPQGRSRSTLVPPAVKLAALDAGLPILQPALPVGDLFLASLRRLEADLGVVVAYGHILRREVLEAPARGMINVHASLLPRFRGAAPIQHAILAGDQETGISIMKMEEGLDSGPVLHRVSIPIADGETGGTLTTRLAALGASALVEALALLSARAERPEPQDACAATYGPKISRETARLDWTRDAVSLERQVRAFDPVPGAWTSLDGAPVKLFGGMPAVGVGEPGAVLAASDRLVVAGGAGAIAVSEVQPAGRNRLTVEEWVRGRGIATGSRFE
ncbi:MAG TPA: methionyl-tRNA formyltransferase [Gemmatimonadales bacterium]|nr:methionyl-tRNA formyltransferase [Gemmatimonadales bacterium]